MYKLREQKIRPGGLNLLAPGDQVAEGDSLDLTGWWPGAAGRLEQAPSYVLLSSPLNLGPHDTVLKADSRTYYAGGGSLWQIGREPSAIDTGYDGTPLGMLSYQGYAWIMNRSKQRKDDGTTTSDWTPSPPGVPTLTDGGTTGAGLVPPANNPPNVGGLSALGYSYYVTWQLGTLGETNPSTVGGVITAATITPAVDGSIVRVTQPAGAPSNATGWNIYRQSPTFSAPYRLNENVIDITRTYVDDYGDQVHTHSDTQLLQLGIIMESDHDPAPAASVIANQVYNGRILVANSAAHPNRIWYTPALQPGFFPGSANENGGNWVDIGTDKGDAIQAIAVHVGFCVIYRQHSIWKHVGDFGAADAIIAVAVPDLGTCGPRGVVSTSLGDYFISNDGVYLFNNDWAKPLSRHVDPLFLGKTTENFPQLGTAYRSQCAIGYRNGRLWVSYPGTSGAMTGSLIYHLESDNWHASPLGYGAFVDTGSDFLGAGHGIYSVEHVTSTNPYAVRYQSAYQDCDLPDHEKTWADLVLSHNTQGQTLTVFARVNKNGGNTGDDTHDSATSFALATINSSTLTRQIIPLVYPATYAVPALVGKPIRSFSLSIRITGNGALTPMVIESPMLLHYYVESRRARRFDTSVTDHGIEGVKEVDMVEFDIDASQGGAFQIASDIPGGVVTDRLPAGQAIAATSGRQSIRLVFSSAVDGQLLRYVATTTADFEIYSARARVLPIGVYLDGTVGDFWQPQPVSIGV
jgi:hypothetical protein